MILLLFGIKTDKLILKVSHYGYLLFFCDLSIRNPKISIPGGLFSGVNCLGVGGCSFFLNRRVIMFFIDVAPSRFANTG